MIVLLSSTCAQPTPTSSAPERFEYAEGGLGSSVRVSWENGKLLYITSTLDLRGKYGYRERIERFVRSTLNLKGKGGYRNRIERFHPSPEAWERFWSALDAAGVWKWQPYYSSEPCCDGLGWRVELRHAGHSMKSEGYCNYLPEFDAFRNAVDQLINDSRHKPPHPQK